MTRRWPEVAAMVFATGCASLSPRPEDFTPGVVPAGVELAVELDEVLAAHWATPNDPIVGRTMGAVRSPSGELLIPDDAIVRGRVVERRTYDFQPAIWVLMDSLEMGGVEQSISGEVVAVRSPPTLGRRSADGSLRGTFPRGSRFEVRLGRPITSFTALRHRPR